MLENFPLELLDYVCVCGWQHTVMPSLNKWQHLDICPSFVVPSPYTSRICLSIFSGQIFLAFENHISDCMAHVAEFFIFVFIFTDYREWRKTLWHSTTQRMCFPWHIGDDGPFEEVHASPTWQICVTDSYFLDAPCVMSCSVMGSILLLYVYMCTFCSFLVLQNTLFFHKENKKQECGAQVSYDSFVAGSTEI